MPSVKDVHVEKNFIIFHLKDGRVVAVPLIWFPLLASADAPDFEDFKIGPYGVHWPNLDEDISIEGVLEGRGCQYNITESTNIWATVLAGETAVAEGIMS